MTMTAADLPLARSLRATDGVEGDLELDSYGYFRATRSAVLLFDAFLAAEGEESPSAIRAKVVAAARSRVPAQEMERVMVLFDDYLEYRRYLAKRLSRDITDVKAALKIMRGAQRDFFGAADAKRMFGLDDLLGEVTVERSVMTVDSAAAGRAR
jgi:lipase chaperone LimK